MYTVPREKNPHCKLNYANIVQTKKKGCIHEYVKGIERWRGGGGGGGC